MSFDVFLVRFHNGGGAPKHPRVVAELREVAEDVLPKDIAGVQIIEGDQPEQFTIELDGDTAYVGAKDAAFFLHSIHPWELELMYRLAVAGDMTILPAAKDFTPIMVDESQRSHLPDDFKSKACVCHSAKDLGRLLVPGYEGYQAYRQHVLELQEDEGESL